MANDDLESRLIRGVGVALVESTGLGFLSKVLKEVFPKHAEQAQQRAFDQIKRRLAEVEAQIDEQQAWTPEFYELFNDWSRITHQTAREEKIRAATNIVANALLRNCEPDKLPYDELDHFTRCVEHLSAGAIHVAGEAYALAALNPLGRKEKLGTENRPVDFAGLTERLRDSDPDLLFGLLGDLHSYNIVHLRYLNGVHFGGSGKYAMYRIEITPLGCRFVRHVLSPGGQRAVAD